MSSRPSAFDPPLLYARVWEDDSVLRAGLRITAGDAVLSIASAGENSLALLLDDPREVVLVDRNRTQLALIHLKIACLTQLEPRDGRRFLGFESASPTERARVYRGLRSRLPAFAQAVFDAAPEAVAVGLLNTGKFERYLATFRRVVLPLVQTPATIAAMTSLADPVRQSRLYDSHWNNVAWRTLFRVFFGRRVMERLGRERAFFQHVTADQIGDIFAGRAKKALCDLPVATNPYLLWILTGRSLPPAWLDDRTAPLIASRADRIRIVEADLLAHVKEAPRQSYAAFNLSDCFEYLSEEHTREALLAIADAATPNARLVYWNLLVPRDASALPERFAPDTALAAALFRQDRAFFYGRLVIERVLAPGPLGS